MAKFHLTNAAFVYHIVYKPTDSQRMSEMQSATSRNQNLTTDHDKTWNLILLVQMQ